MELYYDLAVILNVFLNLYGFIIFQKKYSLISIPTTTILSIQYSINITNSHDFRKKLDLIELAIN